MTGTNCDWFTHNQSLSYLNHLVYVYEYYRLRTLSEDGNIHIHIYNSDKYLKSRED
jgi:hypothetical protein